MSSTAISSYLPISAHPQETVVSLKEKLKPMRSGRDIRLTIFAFFYFISCLFIVCIANSIADRINPNNHLPVSERKPLPDVFLSFLNYYYKRWNLPVDLSDRMIAVSAICTSIRIFSMGPRTLTVTRRFLFVAGTVYLIRAVTVVLTVLPNPLKECESTPHENLFHDALHESFSSHGPKYKYKV